MNKRDYLWFPSLPAGSAYWPARALTAPLRRRKTRIEILGLENVPAVGPVIIAANRVGPGDATLLLHALRRKTIVLAPPDRATRRYDPARGIIAYEDWTMRRFPALAKGEVVAGFPEGAHRGEPTIQSGSPDIVLLAWASGAALIPTGLSVTNELRATPNRSGRPVFRIRFGPPMDTVADAATAEPGRRATLDLMHAIAMLAGRPYGHGSTRHPSLLNSN